MQQLGEEMGAATSDSIENVLVPAIIKAIAAGVMEAARRIEEDRARREQEDRDKKANAAAAH